MDAFEDKQLVEGLWHTPVVLSPYTLIPSSSQKPLNQKLNLPKMASLNMFLAPPAISTTTTSSSSITTTTNTSIATTRARRVQTFATAAKGSGGSSEEKGFFEWLMGAMQRDQLVETDPILQKVEGKSGTTTVSSKKTTTVAAPPKKSGGNGGFGGLGGLFAKK
ncbi:hypothetical protein L2E82_50176 [Cichorium intybus]|nr:hypothetical protein L2E82_50176 [Cichorium intybus]